METMKLKMLRGLGRVLSPQNRTCIVNAVVRCHHPARRHSSSSAHNSHSHSTDRSPVVLSKAQRSEVPVQRVVIPCTCPHSIYLSTSSRTSGKMAPKGTEDVVQAGEEPSTKLYFVKMTPNASTPSKGSKLAAGYDLKSAYDCVVPKRGSELVKTDIQIRLPAGTYGRVAPRSGLAWKNKLDVGAGVIDEDYRGNIGVILFNHSDEDFTVTKGDRIAQLICEKICYPDIEELETLDETERGVDGFGSTGIKKAKVELEVEAKPVEVQPSS